MYRLFAFVSRNRHLFTFLLLEGIAFWIIVRFNEKQQGLFGDFVSDLAGSYYQSEDKVADYFALRQQNELLIANIQRLEAELEVTRSRADLNYYLLKQSRVDTSIRAYVDTAKGAESFIYLPGKVVRNSIDRTYNYLTVNRGRKDGVVEGMGIVSAAGVAGKVVRVSERFSIALSVLNLSFSLTLKAVKPDQPVAEGTLGFFEWDGRNSREGLFRFVPGAESVGAGDWLVTAGYNTIFPEGIRFGQVIAITEVGEDGLSVARIRLATDFSRLGYIYFVGAKHQAELDSLKTGLPDA